ncbi:MAG: hypothetical protein FIA97_00970 [Methylococcaceae bacterium]|nr:hypothetical protein [Methylococcaceae bacterium]
MNVKTKTVLLCLLLAGCTSSQQKAPEPAPAPIATQPKAEKLGDSLLATPAKVWSELGCENSSGLPLAGIEEQQLTPPKVNAGDQFMHRIEYALCPDSPDITILGTLSRKIYLKGKLVHNGQQPFELRPGRWRVNAIIKVPDKSKAGTYTLHTEFVGEASSNKKLKVSKEIQFEVAESSGGS